GSGWLCGRPNESPRLRTGPPVDPRPHPRCPAGRGPGTVAARLKRQSPRRPAGPVQLPATGTDLGDRYARAALAQELARVATAPVGQRNRQLWESTRNLYNLV